MAQPSWETRLGYALSNASFTSAGERLNVETAINTMHSHINALIKFQPGPTQLTGLVTLIRPLGEEEDTCGLIKVSTNKRYVDFMRNTLDEPLKYYYPPVLLNLRPREFIFNRRAVI
jgi:hypothetical protein